MDASVDTDFVGWTAMSASPGYDASLAPLFTRTADDGARLGMRVAERHLNLIGKVHGGCLLALADCALFRIARRELGGMGVTVSLAGDFLGPAGVGDILEAGGEVLRAGGSLIFIRGLITTRERPVLGFTGVIKRLRTT